MEREIFSEFKSGIDRRYLENDRTLQAFHLLKNCHISNNNRIQKRGGLIEYEVLDATTVGLFPFNGRLYTFQANTAVAAVVAQAVALPEIWTISLEHTGTLIRLNYAGVLLGGIYISVTFDDERIAHYYLDLSIDEWTNDDGVGGNTGKVYTENPEGMRVLPVDSIDETNKVIKIGQYQEAVKLQPASVGVTEPVWPDLDGAFTPDGDINWKDAPLIVRDGDNQTYQPHEDGIWTIPIGKLLPNVYWVYKAINAEPGKTIDAGEAPDPADWPTNVGETFVDGEIIWEAFWCRNWNTDRRHTIDFPITDDSVDPVRALVVATGDGTTNLDWIRIGEWLEVKGGATEPLWPTVGNVIEDGDVNWRTITTEVLDENCPNTEQIYILRSKVYAIGSNIESIDEHDIVRYCATNAPFDWSTERDAGFLPVGAQSSGSEIARSLGRYDGRLVVLMDDTIEIWTVDEDPELNSLFQTVGNLGTTFDNTGRGIGTDFVFLTPYGFRSLGAREGYEDFEDTDIGSPIDDLISESLLASSTLPVSTLFTTEGQYVCAIGGELWVWTWSANSDVKAWSVYPISVAIEYFAQLSQNLFMRTADNRVLVVDKTVKTDYTGDFEVDIDFLYQSLKSIGINKQFYGFDVLCEGVCDVSFGYDSNVRSDESLPITVEGSTRSGQMNPMEIVSTEIAPRIRYTGPNDLRVDSIAIYFEKLGLI